MKKAVVLLSGGLDSATTLYLARKQGYECYCLIFDYGQRHKKEIESAKRIAKAAGCRYQILKISLPWKGSSLLDKNIAVPRCNNAITQRRNNEIPSTYVPARNIIFLSFALSFAEGIGARAIFIGAHSQDYSGYPDCRPEFYRAFKRVILTGTKSGVGKKGSGAPRTEIRGSLPEAKSIPQIPISGLKTGDFADGIKIETPLIHKSKAGIVRMAKQLGVPFALTWSCYRGGNFPCGECDSCHYRAKGFQESGIIDPLIGR